MNKRTVGVSALVAAAYIGLPYLLAQCLNLGQLRQGAWSRYHLALTFDDGPDPQTTPAVLDALQAAGAQATFFVMSAAAQAHPDLIARILREDHQVELHALRHVHAWARSPLGAYLDPLRGAEQLSRVTGVWPRYHRPPHGAYSLATVLGQRRAELTGAHWDVEAHDWHPQYTPQRVTQRVLALAHPGAVVVMHDAGVGARNTVPALPGLLAALSVRGYTFKRLDELPGLRALRPGDLPRRLVGLSDQFFDRLGHVTPVAGRADTLFRVGLSRLPFGPVTLANGQVLEKGAPVLDFHINSPLMVDYGLRSSTRRARTWDFPLLAAEIALRPEWRQAQAISTIGGFSSLLHFLGFETHEVPPALARRLSRWSRVLRRAYAAADDGAPIRLSVLSLPAFAAKYADKGKDQQDGGPFEPPLTRSQP